MIMMIMMIMMMMILLLSFLSHCIHFAPLFHHFPRCTVISPFGPDETVYTCKPYSFGSRTLTLPRGSGFQK